MLIATLLFTFIAAANPQVEIDILKVGEEAPQFMLTPINIDECGMKRYSLSHMKNMDEAKRPKAYLVTFFATWCQPCKRELPALQGMYQRLGKSGLSIVNISIDREPGDKAALLELVKKNGLTFPVLWDSSAVTGKRYKVPNRLPYEVLLDAEGKVLKVLVGPNPDDLHKLEAEIRAIIGAAEAPGSAAHAQPAPQAAPQVQQPPAAAPAAGAQQTR